MKGLDWAKYYDIYHEQTLDVKGMEQKISELVGDDEIQNSKELFLMYLLGMSIILTLEHFLIR